jgi:ribonuclease E
MPNKMLIDATHPEETRVVVLRGQRVEEFDFESASRKQLRGNIYLAKVTRVEPSLQAAFVDYGGNRHGFLAFSEIHPDYYQIPIADRQALIAEEEQAQRAADAEADHTVSRQARRSPAADDKIKSEPLGPDGANENEATVEVEAAAMAAGSEELLPQADVAEPVSLPATIAAPETDQSATASLTHEDIPIELSQLQASGAAEPMPNGSADSSTGVDAVADRGADGEAAANFSASTASEALNKPNANIMEVNGLEGEVETVESVGGADAMEEVPERTPRLRRQYKIQEVIKRRQVMLVQVVKEERGTKGAALTTYLSLAGRYSVLMPNTARGGGISRKITSLEDRRRLKEIAQELEVPEGMGVILRTAGATRTKIEVKRDFEYLLRLWETVRDLTLRSTAPKLVYEEGSLVKRSIRDLYNKEIDEILVAGDASFQEAKGFMGMLMPSHARNVKPYRDTLPIFARYGIESQLDAMFTPVMQLRSGGYIVINQAEALVAIDVNSGRATREHHIEDTALKTNLEAAEEIARQLRLRDLAGLIVIDFIDMDEKRNNRAVERRLKECLRHDRARIQVGHISHFGLLEMSRQRIRSSVLESSTEKCPHCGGTGHVRSVASVALQLLRSLEEMLLKGATHDLIVRTRSEIALYLLNHKRAHLRSLEERFRVTILINADPSVGPQLSFVIERGEQVHSFEEAKALAAQSLSPAASADAEAAGEESEVKEEGSEEDSALPGDEVTIESAEQPDGGDLQEHGLDGPDEFQGGRRRRRRRRGRRGGEGRDAEAFPQEASAPVSMEEESFDPAAGEQGSDRLASTTRTPGAQSPDAQSTEGPNSNIEGERRRRRRGRRGGRRTRYDREPEAASGPGGSLGSQSPDGPNGQELESHSDDPAQPPSRDVQPLTPAEQQEEVVHVEPPPQAPASVPDPTAVPTPAATEPVRRRSTVREPAIASSHNQEPELAPAGEPPPSPEPVAARENPGEQRPRRSGWWSRRVFDRS